MPFDHMPREPERPTYDRDAAALAVQKELGRPLSWYEYVGIWNTLTEAMGADDYLTGEQVPVDE